MTFSPDKTGKLLISAAVVWLLLVCVQGLLAGYDLAPIKTDFTPSGSFGDSFGPLSALMAAAAAIGAWQAVLDQRAALQKADEREIVLTGEVARRDFETTFFNLFHAFDHILGQIDIGSLVTKVTGKDAFSVMVRKVRRNKHKHDLSYSTAYERVFLDHQNDLAHYLRTLFNMIAFVDKSSIGDKYFYVKLIRATLSEQELIILGLNGLFHEEGRSKFKPLIERYALLNNISDAAKADFDFADKFTGYEKTAFGI